MSEQLAAGEITLMLADWARGRAEPAPELWEIVCRELRKIARAYVRNNRPGLTLEPTALVNEAYIRVFQGRAASWASRKHFFCAMARTMRQVLVDHARQCQAEKRGGEWERVTLHELASFPVTTPDDILILQEALTELSRLNQRQAQIVELRYFGGLTREETAAILGVSAETVKLEWDFARAWLKRRLRQAVAR
jgi:RNA polymerase sigma-70 factor (ECF subfamily)